MKMSHDKPLQDDIESSDVGMDQLPESPTVKATNNAQMRMELSSFASSCDRYGVSDRVAATIASSMLQDVGLLSTQSPSKVIDRCKIRREREKIRSILQKQTGPEYTGQCTAIFFDGRKDKTLIQVAKGDTLHRQTVIEEHITLIQEPGSTYLAHTAPESGAAVKIKDSILDCMTKMSIDIRSIRAIGCDGTPTNTGSKGGVIVLMEKECGRPLQWLVCLLHANELPLRHLFQHLDGMTTGPHGFSGPIGKQLQNCQSLNPVRFERIEGNVQELLTEVKKDLSADQKFLHDMCQTVAMGECTGGIENRQPGKLSHSRWLTTANRILRLYVATDQSSTTFKNLLILAEFVVKVYAPMWFIIKSGHSCTEGARHIWKMAHLSRYLSDDLKAVVYPVIQRNGFFAHPENMLLAMLADEREHIRELAVRRIRKAREIPPALNPREFTVPKLLLNADDYTQFIFWPDCVVTEPPLTKDFTVDLLKDIFNQKEKFGCLTAIPCHTQAIERCIKIVSEASISVCGDRRRDGFIRSKIESRKKLPKFETKRDFKC